MIHLFGLEPRDVENRPLRLALAHMREGASSRLQELEMDIQRSMSSGGHLDPDGRERIQALQHLESEIYRARENVNWLIELLEKGE
jgi:hypothetical protein